jgi:Tfp pilus assembly protein PilN
MKPLVNLSSRPFRNRRLFWLAILLIFAVSSLVGFSTLETISELDSEIASLEPRVKKKEEEAKKLETSINTVPALTPEQTLSMLAARDLIERKAFSWSQLFNEIERLIPPTVRMRKIALSGIEEKQSAESGSVMTVSNSAAPKSVSLTFDVTGKNYTEVVKMMETFNTSGHFYVTPAKQNNLEGTEEVEFELRVVYYPPVPRRAGQSVPVNQVAKGGR